MELTCRNEPGLSWKRDARPHISQQDNHWRIGIQYNNDRDMSYEVRISHSYADSTNHVKVIANLMGDTYEVVTNHQWTQRIAEYIEHERGPNPETPPSEEDAKNWADEQLYRINDRIFWETVEDALRRWDAMIYLFSPSVACRA